MSRFRTHYDNLKVSRDAPPEVIRSAYRALVNKYHPDRNNNSERVVKVMQAINASFAVLNDPEKRKAHDDWIDRMAGQPKQRDYTRSPDSSPTPPEGQASEHPERSASKRKGLLLWVLLSLVSLGILGSVLSRCGKDRAEPTEATTAVTRFQTQTKMPTPTPAAPTPTPTATPAHAPSTKPPPRAPTLASPAGPAPLVPTAEPTPPPTPLPTPTPLPSLTPTPTATPAPKPASTPLPIPSPTTPVFRFTNDPGFLIRVKGGVLPESSKLAGAEVRDFFVAPAEVSWSEWSNVTRSSVVRDYDLNGRGMTEGGRSHPAVAISWYDALKWCNARSEGENLQPVYYVGGKVYRKGNSVPTVDQKANGYRLPSEAEWEWAARGGDSLNSFSYSGSDNIQDVAWYVGNAERNKKGESVTSETKEKSPNGLGLFDMSGNAAEWCWDNNGSEASYRGGSADDDEMKCRVDFRDQCEAGYGWWSVGLRVFRNADSVQKTNKSNPKAITAITNVSVASAIRAFTDGWGNEAVEGSPVRRREFTFTVVAASYNGMSESSAGDDLPNLLEFAGRESMGKIKADCKDIRTVSLASEELLTIKPLFIYLTGSENFELSDAEVTNLQKYIRLGGAIWGNDQTDGRRDFNIAFRREMMRVMPDKSKEFESINAGDPSMRKDPFFPNLKRYPEAFARRYFGELAIIYTVADFSAKTPDSSLSSLSRTKDAGDLEFGVNLIAHLLTRWEEKLRASPRE